MSKENLSSEPKLVKPENALKKKVGNGGFEEATLNKAQGMIESNQIDFTPQAEQLIAELKETLTQLKTDPDNINQNQVDNLMYPLMQLKSQGTLFHYGAITKMSHIVLDFLENIPAFDKEVLDIVSAYKKSVKAVLKYKIKDENNKVAKEFYKELSDVCARYRAHRL